MNKEKSTSDILYLSAQLSKKDEYKPFWNRLKLILTKNKIEYRMIDNTRDIWSRDYMPIQINDDEFIQFTYFPDYLISPKHIAELTIPSEIVANFKGKITNSRLIIDGGNITKSKSKLILTKKIYKENSNLLQKTINNELRKLLKVKDIFILPIFPFDYTGHSDGMVRFVNENQLLVADYSKESKSWQKKMKTALDKIEKAGIELIPFPNIISTKKNKYGDCTAIGIYINFAQIGKHILFPQFDIMNDEKALKKIKEIYKEPEYNVIPILSNEIAEYGGVLNCITWNIRQ